MVILMLKIHFLNVGHGDCCILEFPEKVAMVDINRNKNPCKGTVVEADRPGAGALFRNCRPAD